MPKINKDDGELWGLEEPPISDPKNATKIDKEVMTKLIALKLGELYAKGLFSNYPDNFNKLLPQIAEDLEKNQKLWLKEE
ncbi:MAG: hypothetical protein PHY56_06260 [Candidatus Omnitrophica bacterium]|nr:hypothetical protein [Candidatus Omnitrophota bacterium]